MGRTTIIPGDPYEAHARVAREALEYQRDSYIQRARITEAQIAAGTIRADHLSAGTIKADMLFGFKRTHFHDTDVRGPETQPRYFTNCCNCGAPRTAHECSYCKSVTP